MDAPRTLEDMIHCLSPLWPHKEAPVGPHSRRDQQKVPGGLELPVIGCSLLWLTGRLVRRSSKLRVVDTVQKCARFTRITEALFHLLCCRCLVSVLRPPSVVVDCLTSTQRLLRTFLQVTETLSSVSRFSVPGRWVKWQRSGAPRAPWASRRTRFRWRLWSERRRDEGRTAKMSCLPDMRTQQTSPTSPGARYRGLTGCPPGTKAVRLNAQATSPVSE